MMPRAVCLVPLVAMPAMVTVLVLVVLLVPVLDVVLGVVVLGPMLAVLAMPLALVGGSAIGIARSIDLVAPAMEMVMPSIVASLLVLVVRAVRVASCALLRRLLAALCVQRRTTVLVASRGMARMDRALLGGILAPRPPLMAPSVLWQLARQVAHLGVHAADGTRHVAQSWLLAHLLLVSVRPLLDVQLQVRVAPTLSSQLLVCLVTAPSPSALRATSRQLRRRRYERRASSWST